jgi:hypothetical protein
LPSLAKSHLPSPADSQRIHLPILAVAAESHYELNVKNIWVITD